MQDDLLNAQFLPRNLHEDRVHALPHLRSGAVHLGDGATRSSEQFHAAFRRIVKTFAVGDVLVADGKPDAPPQSLAATHIPCTAPNPRIAPQGGLCVYTAVPSINALGTS